MKKLFLLTVISILTVTCSAMNKRTTADYEAAIAARAARRSEYFAEQEEKEKARSAKRAAAPKTKEQNIERAQRAVNRAKSALDKHNARRDRLEKLYQDALHALGDAKDPILFEETDEEDSEQEEIDDNEDQVSVVVVSSTSQNSQDTLAQHSSDSSMYEPHFHGIRTSHYQFVSMWHRMSGEEKKNWLQNISSEDLALVKRYDGGWYEENIKQ